MVGVCKIAPLYWWGGYMPHALVILEAVFMKLVLRPICLKVQQQSADASPSKIVYSFVVYLLLMQSCSDERMKRVS